MSSPAATPTLWNDAAQWQLQQWQFQQLPGFYALHQQQQLEHHMPILVQMQQQMEQLKQMCFQMQKQMQELQQDALQQKLRQASAARPQRREREQMKRGRQPCGSSEAHRNAESTSDESPVLQSHAHDELDTSQNLNREFEETSLLRRVIHELQSHTAKALADKEAGLKEALAAQKVCSKAHEAEKAALDAARIMAEKELSQRTSRMAAESLEFQYEQKSLRDELSEACSAALAVEERLQTQLTQLEGALMGMEDLQARILLLQTATDIAEGTAAGANAERDVALEDARAARVDLHGMLQEHEAMRVQLANCQSECESKQSALASMQVSADAAHAEAIQAKTEQQRAESAAQDASDERDRLQLSAESALARAAEAHTEQQRAESVAENASAQRDMLSQCIQSLVQECTCPILHSMFRDPVVTADGHCYEREGISHWLNEHGTSPMTGLNLGRRDLLPNHLVARLARLLRGDPSDDAASEGSHATTSNPQEEALVLPGALWAAARRGDRAECLAMLDRGVPDINHKADEGVRVRVFEPGHGYGAVMMGTTVLHLAVLQDWPDVCRAILAAPGFSEMEAKVVHSHGWNTTVWASAVYLACGKSPELQRLQGLGPAVWHPRKYSLA